MAKSEMLLTAIRATRTAIRLTRSYRAGRFEFATWTAVAIASLAVLWWGTMFLSTAIADPENGWFIIVPGTAGLLWALTKHAILLDRMNSRLRDLESKDK